GPDPARAVRIADADRDIVSAGRERAQVLEHHTFVRPAGLGERGDMDRLATVLLPDDLAVPGAEEDERRLGGTGQRRETGHGRKESRTGQESELLVRGQRTGDARLVAGLRVARTGWSTARGGNHREKRA